MPKPVEPNKAKERKQLHILLNRIGNILCRNDVQFLLSARREYPKLIDVVSKEHYALIKQMLWDEYQHHLEPIDSLEETAFILQNRIEKSITI